ncbi:MAG TPA: DUF3071 domain-containing protein, partial [Streptosporangiaceae bacterium]|nr:DUF3071 domain-containing protein [Streptosporangiaceae bacterium]
PPARAPEPAPVPRTATPPDPEQLLGAGPAGGHEPGPPAEAAEEPADGPGAGKDGRQAQPARTGRKAGQRGRRSSVPSWDEIMLGNSRQQE